MPDLLKISVKGGGGLSRHARLRLRPNKMSFHKNFDVSSAVTGRFMFVVLCLLLFVVFMFFLLHVELQYSRPHLMRPSRPPSGAPGASWCIGRRPSTGFCLFVILAVVVVVVGAGFKLSQSDCGFA